jgi:hypothetical protein
MTGTGGGDLLRHAVRTGAGFVAEFDKTNCVDTLALARDRID